MNSFLKTSQYKRTNSLLNIVVFERLGKHIYSKTDLASMLDHPKPSKIENHKLILNKMIDTHNKAFPKPTSFEDTESWNIFKDVYVAHIDCVHRNHSKYTTSVFRKMLRNNAFKEFLKNRWGLERVDRIRDHEKQYIDQFFCSDFRDFSLKQFDMYDLFIQSKFANKFDKFIAKMRS